MNDLYHTILKPDHERRLLFWQEDASVNNCSVCDSLFNLMNRKHHCRSCGYIICNKCSNKKTWIPKFLKIPKPDFEFNILEPQRICDKCNQKIQQLNKISFLILVFNNLDLDLKDISVMAQVCRKWKKYAEYYVSQFRTIQYELFNYKYTEQDKHMLWCNRRYLISHKIWYYQLLKSLNYSDSEKIQDLLALLRESNNKVKVNCDYLYCSRLCEVDKTYVSLLLCDKNILCDDILKLALRYVKPDIMYIPYLLKQAEESASQCIFKWLIKQSAQNLVYANNLFWEIKIGLHNTGLLKKKYQLLLNNWRAKVPSKFKHIIETSEEIVKILESAYFNKDSVTLGLKRLSENLSEKKKFILPTHIQLGYVYFQKCTVKSSNSSPVILEFLHLETRQTVKILYKQENIRSDQIVMSVIYCIQNLLNYDIITYQLRPTSNFGGFIEIVENCCTLYDISKNKISLLNYILDKNPNTNAKLLRDKFLKSTAIYSAITYLLGIGDRHSENIMITDSGVLFHIDFNKFSKTSSMRVSKDMLDTLGGKNSDVFKNFSELCANKIYNSLRRHVNYIICLFSVLQIDLDGIIKRFVPGESYQKAKLQFYDKIEHSTRNYKHSLKDLIHYVGQEGVKKTMFDLWSYF